MEKRTARGRLRRAVAPVALTATLCGITAGGVAAGTIDTTTTSTTTTSTTTTVVSEAYPPAVTVTTVPPKLPPTGNAGTDGWLRVGAGALLAGGLLVAGASRRRSMAGER